MAKRLPLSAAKLKIEPILAANPATIVVTGQEINFSISKIAKPEKTVVNIMGDASFGMAGLDIETAVRSKIPIITVVLNNGVMTNYTQPSPYLGYAAEKWDLHKLTGDYAKIADGLGAFSKKVKTPEEIAPAIKEALNANKTGQPALLEI